MKILFFAKKDKPYVPFIKRILENKFDDVETYLGARQDPFPCPKAAACDVIISYLSPWIIPQSLLSHTKQYVINFHPGPPEYPGIGCVNYALYNEEKEYGVVCHHMNTAVDTGTIIRCERFPIGEKETVLSLLQKSYDHLFSLAKEVIALIAQGSDLPQASEQWTRKPFTRNELNALCRLRMDMDCEEIERRVRATEFIGYPGAYFQVGDYRVEYNAKHSNA